MHVVTMQLDTAASLLIMTSMQTNLPPLVAIVGPTAVGKTALSLQLAQRFAAEIISADSRLVYQGMDIGTAKPTAQEQALVPHHLIDCVPPDGEYSLARFQCEAYAAIAAVTERGRLPLIVGGTGQYVAAVVEGWQIPQVAPQLDLRRELEAFVQTAGTQALHDRLAAVDPQAAHSIDASNVRRVIRALEVWNVTGIPISVLQERQPPPYRVMCMYLDRPRDVLYQRIDQRVDAMIQAGLIAEVFGLVKDGYHWDLPAMSGLGYAEWQPLWTGAATAGMCIERLKFNTHRFARKQGNWFRRLPKLHLLNAEAESLSEQAEQLVTSLLDRDTPDIDH